MSTSGPVATESMLGAGDVLSKPAAAQQPMAMPVYTCRCFLLGGVSSPAVGVGPPMHRRGEDPNAMWT
eukprot:2395163-Alexandrium_andersonii.AAC.1